MSNEKKQIIENAFEKNPLHQRGEISTDIFTLYNVTHTLTGEKTIFFAVTDKQAKKIFLDSINSDAKNEPTEFVLTKNATWNKITGVVTPIDNEFVMNGVFQKQIDDNLKSLIATLVEQKLHEIKLKQGDK